MPGKEKLSYPPILWAQIRALYESGAFAGVEAVCEQAKQLYKKCPSIMAVRKRCQLEQWEKNTHKKEIEQANLRCIQRLFNEEGLTDRDLVKYIVAGVKHVDSLYADLVKKIESEKGELTIDFAKSLDRLFKDFKVQLGFIHIAAKLKGLDAEARKPSGAGGPVGKVGEIEDDLSYEEMLREHERIMSL